LIPTAVMVVTHTTVLTLAPLPGSDGIYHESLNSIEHLLTLLSLLGAVWVYGEFLLSTTAVTTAALTAG
jgi:hypothetical protein